MSIGFCNFFENSEGGVLPLEFARRYRKFFLKASGKIELVAKAELRADRGDGGFGDGKKLSGFDKDHIVDVFPDRDVKLLLEGASDLAFRKEERGGDLGNGEADGEMLLDIADHAPYKRRSVLER